MKTYYNYDYGYTTKYNYYYGYESYSYYGYGYYGYSSYNGYYSYSVYSDDEIVKKVRLYYALIIGVPIGVCVLCSVIGIVCICRNTRLKKHKYAPDSVGSEMNVQVANGPDGPSS